MNKKMTVNRSVCLKRLVVFGIFAAFLLAGTRLAWAQDVKLDENTEVQWVMGDLYALKTAAQMYHSDSGERTPPSVAALMTYFEPGSFPSNASALYALKGDEQGWYVGYRSDGLQSDTYRLLEANAQTLGLLGDDLRGSWRQGSRYFWAEALVFGSVPATVGRNDNTYDNAVLIAATAALVNIITDSRSDRYYYHTPGRTWYWHSALVYRPAYYRRFFSCYYRPLAGLSPRFHPPRRYRYKAPRAGWLNPSWRHSLDYARRYPDSRFHDRKPSRPRPVPDRNRVSRPLPPPRYGHPGPKREPPHLVSPNPRPPRREPPPGHGNRNPPKLRPQHPRPDRGTPPSRGDPGPPKPRPQPQRPRPDNGTPSRGGDRNPPRVQPQRPRPDHATPPRGDRSPPKVQPRPQAPRPERRTPPSRDRNPPGVRHSPRPEKAPGRR